MKTLLLITLAVLTTGCATDPNFYGRQPTSQDWTNALQGWSNFYNQQPTYTPGATRNPVIQIQQAPQPNYCGTYPYPCPY